LTGAAAPFTMFVAPFRNRAVTITRVVKCARR
jgi:hypothetical protein